MNKTPSPLLVARLDMQNGVKRNFETYCIELSVSFSFIEAGYPHDTPEFIVASMMPRAKSRQGVTDMSVRASLHKDDYSKQGAAGLAGYKPILTPKFRTIDAERAERFVKLARSISRSMDKHQQKGWEPTTYAGYLQQLFRVLRVDVIWFEALSQTKGRSQWQSYSVTDLPALVDQAVEHMAQSRHWTELAGVA
ncbi:hypothetical protein [Aliagarivorans taiwanensis]|uniref:hypothetical protein n=1 Tax=Aliagarivorans taiwanensis TaxID=561966 RepID=UPI00041B663A|nr:hypothetical protein [Aliagarivorans taiwanensis]